MKRKLTVKKFLQGCEPDVIRVLVDHANPRDTFAGKKLKDVILWPFGEVFEHADKEPPKAIIDILKSYCGLEESDILAGSAIEFVSLLKHIQNEFTKIRNLMDQLQSNEEVDSKLINAGVENLNKYGLLNIYYSIDKNPLAWDAISEGEFIKVYMRLSIDKTNAEINKNIQDQTLAEMQSKRNYGHS